MQRCWRSRPGSSAVGARRASGERHQRMISTEAATRSTPATLRSAIAVATTPGGREHVQGGSRRRSSPQPRQSSRARTTAAIQRHRRGVQNRRRSPRRSGPRRSQRHLTFARGEQGAGDADDDDQAKQRHRPERAPDHSGGTAVTGSAKAPVPDGLGEAGRQLGASDNHCLCGEGVASTACGAEDQRGRDQRDAWLTVLMLGARRGAAARRCVRCVLLPLLD